mgnify:CR=1 FL=1
MNSSSQVLESRFCLWIQDSKWSVFRDSGFLDLDSGFQKLRFQILKPIFFLDSVFHEFPGFWNLDYLAFESTDKELLRVVLSCTIIFKTSSICVF